jgi:hypothetical protein
MKLKGQGRKLSLSIAQNLQKLYLYLSDARRGALSMCLLYSTCTNPRAFPHCKKSSNSFGGFLSFRKIFRGFIQRMYSNLKLYCEK